MSTKNPYRRLLRHLPTGAHTPKLALCAVLALGCQQDNTVMRKEVESLKSGQEKILAKLDKIQAGGGRGNQPQRPMRPRPMPNEVYSVNIQDAPFVGAKDAKITVVKGFEFACPYCEKVAPTLEQLQKDYEGDIKIAYKHYVVHPNVATLPALTACAAGRQGKWKQMYNLLWEKAFKVRKFDQENMDALAKEAGLDMAKYKADSSGACKQQIGKDQQELGAVGTSGTPAFYINGRYLSGAQPIEQFKRLIDEELKKANDRIGKGEATVANYYDKFVVKAGKKKLDAPKDDKS